MLGGPLVFSFVRRSAPQPPHVVSGPRALGPADLPHLIDISTPAYAGRVGLVAQPPASRRWRMRARAGVEPADVAVDDETNAAIGCGVIVATAL